jgi:hypothetical protein
MRLRIIPAIGVLVCLAICNTALAQNESELWLNQDPHFYKSVRGESNGNIVRIDITCSGETIDDVKKEAIKSALYMLIFEGFEPGPNGEPSINKLTDEVGLYQQKKAEFDSYLTDPNQGMMKAQALLNRTQPGSEVKIGKKKLQKATHTVEVNLENLRADLEGRKLIKPANQSTTDYKPKIVILPSDAWMKANKLHSTKINQQRVVDIYDYKNGLDHEVMTKALTEITSKFQNNFEIINYKEKLKEIDDAVAKNNALTESKQQSPLDIYANVLAADIWVKINISDQKINNNMTNQKFVSIDAYNPYTGNNAFSGRQIEKQSTGDNDWEITRNAIRESCDDIRPGFTKFFKSREESGIQGRVMCSIAESAGDVNFNTEIEIEGEKLKLSEVINAFIGEYTVLTKDGVSKLSEDGAQTSTLIKFKDVFIPVVIEKTRLGKKKRISNSFSELGNSVQKDLENRCGIKTEILPIGIGMVEIVINGRK